MKFDGQEMDPDNQETASVVQEIASDYDAMTKELTEMKSVGREMAGDSQEIGCVG
jgi:hypothetical protein